MYNIFFKNFNIFLKIAHSLEELIRFSSKTTNQQMEEKEEEPVESQAELFPLALVLGRLIPECVAHSLPVEADAVVDLLNVTVEFCRSNFNGVNERSRLVYVLRNHLLANIGPLLGEWGQIDWGWLIGGDL